MSRLKEICDYAITNGVIRKGEIIDYLKESPVLLATLIGRFAHRNQSRVNGENYFNHPISCFNIYLEMIDTDKKYLYDIDSELAIALGLPVLGVYELCLLHDVVEDTDFTIEELEELFDECGYKEYFNKDIKEELRLLTHDKSEEYDVYLERILTNKKASLVKMLDMMSNSRVYTLDKFSEKEYERGLYYYNSIYKINNKYHFIETFNTYRNNRKERAN